MQSDLELARSLEVQALCILAEQFNVPPDMQEWLLAGIPHRRIKPGALRAILSAALTAGREAERARMAAWLRGPGPDRDNGGPCRHVDHVQGHCNCDDLADAIERGDHAGGDDAD